MYIKDYLRREHNDFMYLYILEELISNFWGMMQINRKDYKEPMDSMISFVF